MAASKDSSRPSSNRECAPQGSTPPPNVPARNLVKFNVGGTEFFTSSSTVLNRDGEHFLASLISGRLPSTQLDNGAYFIDRDPTHFRHILNYLRDGSIVTEARSETFLREVLSEAEFYAVDGLVGMVRSCLDTILHKQQMESTGEKEYRLVQGLERRDLSRKFIEYTVEQGWEFEAWIPEVEGRIALLLSRRLSRRQADLLDKLMNC